MGARPNRRGFISLWILYTGIPYAPLPKIQVIYSRALLTLGACILSSIVSPESNTPAFHFGGIGKDKSIPELWSMKYVTLIVCIDFVDRKRSQLPYLKNNVLYILFQTLFKGDHFLIFHPHVFVEYKYKKKRFQVLWGNLFRNEKTVACNGLSFFRPNLENNAAKARLSDHLASVFHRFGHGIARYSNLRTCTC